LKQAGDDRIINKPTMTAEEDWLPIRKRRRLASILDAAIAAGIDTIADILNETQVQAGKDKADAADRASRRAEASTAHGSPVAECDNAKIQAEGPRLAEGWREGDSGTPTPRRWQGLSRHLPGTVRRLGKRSPSGVSGSWQWRPGVGLNAQKYPARPATPFPARMAAVPVLHRRAPHL